MSVHIQCSNHDCQAFFHNNNEDEVVNGNGRCPKCRQTLERGADQQSTVDLSVQEHKNIGSTIQSPAAPIVGEIFGHYRILKELDRGGMGTVYLAEDLRLFRRIALKVPHLTQNQKANAAHRFAKEARAAASLDHPNLCPVLDVGQIDGVPYLTMPLIEGETLKQLLGDKPLPERRAVEIVHSIAQVMETAHRQGVVHRDLKPSNIVISANRGPVILDFGLARLADASDSHNTSPGVVMGTPAYMAPEQLLGQNDIIGPATDIYALGVILSQLLYGKLPFERPTFSGTDQTTETIAQSPIEEPRPRWNQALKAIVLKAMAKEPTDRFKSMAELAEVLDNYLDRNVSSEPASIVATPSRESSYRSGRLAACAGVLVCFGLVIHVANDKGTVTIDIADPDSVSIVRMDGKEIRLEALGEPVFLRTGSHTLEVVRHDLEVQTRAFSIRKGDGNRVVSIFYSPTSTSTPGTVSKRGQAPGDLAKLLGKASSGPEPVPFLRRSPTSDPLSESSSSAAPSPEHKLSMVDADEGVRLNPNNIEPWIVRGNVLTYQNEYERAIADYTKAIEIDPNDPRAYRNRGFLYNEIKEFELAIADYSKAIEIDPDNARAYHNRGYAYRNRNEYNQALVDFDKVIELQPNHAQAYHNRGFIAYLLKNYNRAIADYTKAIEIDPDNADIYRSRAEIYAVKGDQNRARADLEAADRLK